MDRILHAKVRKAGMAGLLGITWAITARSAAAQEEPADFYDPSVLRTLELTFETADFFSEIDRISNSTADGYLAGSLTVDGVVYPGVGVRFRGNTSQRNAGQKRSLKIAVDHTDADQRVHGLRTIKLNNAASDPTFLREALYSQASYRYFPSPNANHVLLVINGQSWSVYVNVQQFNKDFLDDWFERKDGSRFKAPSGNGTGPNDGGGNPGGGNCAGGGPFACGDKALKWLGSEPEPYQARYELKSNDTPDPWGDLVRFCDEFNNTSAVDFESFVPSILDVDSFLWQIALENIFADHDGYLAKGADYTIYQEPDGGRLHTVQHDGNESFDSTSWGLLEGSGNAERPVVQRLFAIPQYRQRYLAHVRAVLDEWFRWDVLGEEARAMRDLIAPEVEKDTKKIYATDLFWSNFESTVTINGGFGGGSLPGLREFVEDRRQTLLASSHLRPTPPAIQAVELDLAPGSVVQPSAGVGLRVRVNANGILGAVIIHHRAATDIPFITLTLADDGARGDGAAGDGVYGGEIPGYPAGSLVRYYVEARGTEATAFEPAGAEQVTLSYRVDVVDAASTPVVINELMAENDTTIADPQGDFDDWVELYNVTESSVELSGMYLSDNESNPRKWLIPAGTVLPAGGYLIVWLDEDGQDEGGLHANFKLASAGEIVWLIDTDARNNQRLDAVAFGELPPDAAWARWPNGEGELGQRPPTPGSENVEPNTSPVFRRGELNGDAAVDLADAVFGLNYLFLGGPAPACLDGADADDSGGLDMTDAVYLLSHLFLAGPPPDEPFAQCGSDPTGDDLGCEAGAACE